MAKNQKPVSIAGGFLMAGIKAELYHFYG